MIPITKDYVLSILRNTEEYVSGEAISKQLGISRAAVNTAVKALRAEGYDIRSSTNRGYHLFSVPDTLTAKELSAYLSEDRMQSIHCYDSVDSTNNRLRELAINGAGDGTIVIANEQQHGRGRRMREFVSLKDRGIYLSILLRPDALPSSVMEITAWTAVAINDAIEEVCGIRPGIKWVNDLMLHQKKVCGILTETSVESETGYVQYVIIGIGINVNHSKNDFPDALRDIATSLALEGCGTCSRAELAAAVIHKLDALRAAWPDNRGYYLGAYRRDNITTGSEITVLSGRDVKSATALSITDQFTLKVRYPDGSEEDLSSGEVSIRSTNSVTTN